MISFLIYIFLKKCRKYDRRKPGKSILKYKRARVHILLAGLIIILLALIPLLSKSQSIQHVYKIIQGEDNIGWLRLEKNMKGNTTNLMLHFEIKTRFIFQINVSAKETSLFENGKLLYSSLFRKTNGSVKLDKQTSRVMDKYEITENGKKQQLTIPLISSNLLSLYFQEPVYINSVYCDKQERYLKIVRTNDGGYKVVFPGGDSNTFYYNNGVCTKIKLNNTFYSAEIVKTF